MNPEIAVPLEEEVVVDEASLDAEGMSIQDWINFDPYDFYEDALGG